MFLQVMRTIIALSCACLIVILISCGGGSGDENSVGGDSDNEDSMDTNSIVSYGFEEELSLDEWEIISGKDSAVSIDSTSSHEGNRSLLLTPDQCLSITTKDYFPVTKGQIYEISFTVIRSGTYVVGCASPFVLLLTQSNEGLLYRSPVIEDGDNWQVQKCYFEAESDDPVRIGFGIGYEMVWIDDIKVKVWEKGTIENQEVLASIGFENAHTLDDWVISSERSNTVSLDKSTSYEGNRSLKVDADKCVSLTMNEHLHVAAGESYQLSIAVRRSGPYVGCAGPFALQINQLGQELLYESSAPQDGAGWEVQTFNFQSNYDVPAKLRIYIGYDTFWIDDLKITLN